MAPYKTWGDGSHLARALFAQDQLWVTAQSKVVEVAEMDLTHALNTLLMIERMTDLPIKDVQGTKLYEALYGRVFDAMRAQESPRPRVQAPTPVEATSLWPYDQTTPWHRRVGVSYETIVAILEAAITAGRTGRPGLESPRVVIDYENRKGEVTLGRLVTPLSLSERRGTFGFNEKYLVALDVAKEESRTFIVRNIKRCEDA